MPNYDSHEAEDARRDRATAAWLNGDWPGYNGPPRFGSDDPILANIAHFDAVPIRAINEADGFDGDHLP